MPCRETEAIKLRRELVSDINVMFEQQWIPEQISGRLKREGRTSICYETICQHKRAGGKPYLNLRHHAGPYCKRYDSATGSLKSIPNRVDIDERPDVANQRERLGDWEADIMIGIRA